MRIVSERFNEAIQPDAVRNLRRELKIGGRIRIAETATLYSGGFSEITQGVIIAKYRNFFVIDCGNFRTAFKYITLLTHGVKWEVRA